jgi:2'-5' RNA ligase
MRLFIAVPLPALLKEVITNWQKTYQMPGMRYIPADNLHLTLHFIGDTPDANVPELQDKLSQIAQRHQPFDLTFQEMAPGPKLRAPRLIWLRFQEHPAFEKLATDICTSLDAAPGAHGKFIPHITIIRFGKDFLGNQSLPVNREAPVPPLRVREFALWQSQLQSPHPKYSVLESFYLPPAAGATS